MILLELVGQATVATRALDHGHQTHPRKEVSDRFCGWLISLVICCDLPGGKSILDILLDQRSQFTGFAGDSARHNQRDQAMHRAPEQGNLSVILHFSHDLC